MFEWPQGFFGGLFPEQGAPNPNGGPYSAQDIAAARWNLIGNLGMQLMAAGQPMTGAQRAQILSGMGGLGNQYRQQLRSGLEDRALQDKLAETEKWRNAPAPSWMTPEQAAQWADMPLDLRRDVQSEYYKSQFAAPGAPHVITLVSPRTGETASLDMSNPTHRQAATNLMDKGWTERQGSPLVQMGEGKLTAEQEKTVIVLPRMVNAQATLDQLGSQYPAITQRFGSWQAYTQTPEGQAAIQAGREFLAMVLRKESGAQVTPAEMTEYGAIYLPQPGEDASTLERKRFARELAVEGMVQSLGAHRSIGEQIRSRYGKGGLTANNDAGPAPEGVTQQEWDAMTPEERRLWQN